VVADAERLCVERQAADPASTFAFARRLAALRAGHPTLQVGAQTMLDAGAEVLAWVREHDGEQLLAAVNFGGSPAPLTTVAAHECLLSTDPTRTSEIRSPFVLSGEEALIARV
jgi:alpha-glucosidase